MQSESTASKSYELNPPPPPSVVPSSPKGPCVRDDPLRVGPAGAQPMLSHCPPDTKCKPQWHL